MLKPHRLYCYRLISSVLPETSCFGFKRRLLRWAGAEIGERVRICSSAQFLGAGALVIGEETWIGHAVFINASGKVVIGKNVDLAPFVYIGTGTHVPDFSGPRCAGTGVNLDISIGAGCWLGARATILPGVVIGAHSIVGAGAVVNKSLPSGITAVGVPAKVLNK